MNLKRTPWYPRMCDVLILQQFEVGLVEGDLGVRVDAVLAGLGAADMVPVAVRRQNPLHV